MANKGVDLTAPGWPHVQPGENVNDPASAWISGVALDEGPSVLRQAERLVRLAGPAPSLPARADVSPLADLELGVSRILRDQGRPLSTVAQGADVRVALAYPYATPWLVQKNLHALFGKGTRLDDRVAVEAPFALALEGLARSSPAIGDESPVRGLYLTRAEPDLELTMLALSRRARQKPGDLLVIEATGFVVLDGADLSAGPVRSAFGAEDQAVPVYHPGLAGPARRVVEALGGRRESIDLGAHAVAAGAVRYGLVLDRQRCLGEDRRTRFIEVRRTAPFALGVLGTNARGDWFWRRISDPEAVPGVDGDRLVGRANLVPGLAAPDRIHVVECTNAGLAARRWLAATDWEAAGLRWHQVVVRADRDPDRWDLRIVVANDRNVCKNTLSYLKCEVCPSERSADADGPTASA